MLAGISLEILILLGESVCPGAFVCLRYPSRFLSPWCLPTGHLSVPGQVLLLFQEGLPSPQSQMVRPQDSKAGMSHIILEAIGRVLEVDMGQKKKKKSNKQEEHKMATLGPLPSLLFWNIVWVFLGESKTLPQRKMKTSSASEPREVSLGGDFGLTVRRGRKGSQRYSHPIPTRCLGRQTGYRGLSRTDKKVKVTECQGDSGPSQDWMERREQSTQISLWALKRSERERLT